MKTLLKIVKYIITAVLCLILAMNLWLIGARVLLHQDLPSIFGYAQVIVTSGSMEPVFSPGDMLIVKAQAQYGLGDVITFRDHGNLVSHRIVKVTADGFETQGDANNTMDKNAVEPSAIAGRVVKVIPQIGNFILFLQSPLGLLLLVVIALVFLEISYLFDQRRGEGTGDHGTET